jgi:hypothetical protein
MPSPARKETRYGRSQRFRRIHDDLCYLDLDHRGFRPEIVPYCAKQSLIRVRPLKSRPASSSRNTPPNGKRISTGSLQELSFSISIRSGLGFSSRSDLINIGLRFRRCSLQAESRGGSESGGPKFTMSSSRSKRGYQHFRDNHRQRAHGGRSYDGASAATQSDDAPQISGLPFRESQHSNVNH